MALTTMTSKQLFLLNGIIEGIVGLIAILSPKIIANTKELHKHGKVYAGFFGPMLFSMSYICILLSNKSDINNDSKHLFAVGWIFYHIGATYNCFKSIFNGNKSLIAGLIFHTFILSSFIMYLKQNNFKLNQLLSL